jgi:hypothetical protein
MSAETAFEFDLATIQSLITKEECRFLFQAGNLPLKPSIVNIWHGVRGSQPILRIEWNARYEVKTNETS